MSLVFKRFPGGGSMRLLALALADHADDSGERIFPSVALLAEKTAQSERAVQYQLQKLLDMGWLQFVGEAKFGLGRGRGHNRGRQYRISPEWMAGLPIIVSYRCEHADDQKGCKICTPSDAKEGVQTPPENGEEGVQDSSRRGATAIAPKPSLNHQEENVRDARAPAGEAAADKPPPDPDVLATFPNDWQPDEACRAILKVQQVPMPETWQVQAFVGHWVGKHIAPRRIPGEFLKWAARERGFAARDAGRAVTTGGQQAVEAADPATRMQAEKAFERLRQLAHRGEFRRDSATEIERVALNAMGGVGAFDTAASADVPKLRARFVAGYCEREQRGQG